MRVIVDEVKHYIDCSISAQLCGEHAFIFGAEQQDDGTILLQTTIGTYRVTIEEAK